MNLLYYTILIIAQMLVEVESCECWLKLQDFELVLTSLVWMHYVVATNCTSAAVNGHLDWFGSKYLRIQQYLKIWITQLMNIWVNPLFIFIAFCICFTISIDSDVLSDFLTLRNDVQYVNFHIECHRHKKYQGDFHIFETIFTLFIASIKRI